MADVRIDELHSTVDSVDGSALLTPEVLSGIVQAVLVELEARERGAQALRSELDMRPIVEQQRGGDR
jgi:hypothetical protein